ncbi:hypothetical protein [Amphibacillus cookii]|uniref:hypothetical protein n=1 Tax=Amphibacillus cookii TaxID=767787 RepID=UPI0019577F4E|nr:hypothetical protein [Amphibacillus cookii]MBM7542743.1 hypothetical protein [Amphibacillus cookii]
MLGLMVTDKELKEMEYLVKREMEELLFDMEDSRVDQVVKQAMTARYRVLFQLLRKIADDQEVIKYIPNYKL